MLKRITIHDLAKAANCSTATVSMVLNGSGRIGAARREEILQLARQLGYQPNVAGRNLRLRRTDTVGLMFYPSPSHLFKNVFYVEVMEALEETFYQNGLNLLLGSGREELLQGVLPKFVRTGATDAIILLGHFPEACVKLLQETSTPIFLLDSAHDTLAVDSLTSDGFDGAARALDHLYELGHRRIAMVAYGRDEFNISNRIRGFQASVARLGLNEAHCPLVNQFQTNEEGPLRLEPFLKGPQPPTACLCVNDHLASSVSGYAQQIGYSVPGDLSVVGFDDDLYARSGHPLLTTVKIDTALLGRHGAEMVIERLHSPEMPVRKVVHPVGFIVRESTAPPRA